MTSLPRVLHVRSSGALLGAENVVIAIARHSARYGYTPVVASLQDAGDPVPELSAVADRLGVESLVLPCRRGVDPGLVRRLRVLTRDRRIQLVHSHGYKEDIHLALARPGLAMVATNHLWKRTDARLRLYARIDAIALRFFDHVVAVSAPIRSDMLRAGLSPDKVTCIANGIDAEDYGGPMAEEERLAVRLEFGFNREHTVILSVSSLSEEKGHVYMLRALQGVCRKAPQTRYLIVGDGPNRRQLEREALALGVANSVVFAGRRADIARLMKAVDVFAMPSLIEGLPMALLEAMASGLPAVASATGDIPKVIENGASGTLCAPGSVGDLEAAVLQYLSDPPRRLAHGSNAQVSAIARFSSSRMTAAYCALYDEVLCRGRH